MGSKPGMLAAAAAIVVLAGVCDAGPLMPPDQAAIDAYRSAIRTAETTRRPRALERAFAALGRLRDALMRVGDDHNTVLESLPEEEFQGLRTELIGVFLNRTEVVYLEPDAAYFSRLAATRGDAADRVFFATLAATYPRSPWPVYVDPKTDFGGCVRFGSMALVDTYRTWSGFRRQYPTRYREASQHELDAVVIELAQSTCACEGVREVERELQEFIRIFPRLPVSPAIEQRLDDLQRGRSTIHANCVPG